MYLSDTDTYLRQLAEETRRHLKKAERHHLQLTRGTRQNVKRARVQAD